MPHDSRWQLALPDATATRDDLARQLDQSLALLRQMGDADDALYFFRLALLHEDMHHEAALYMARGLGIPIDDERWQPQVLPDPGAALRLSAQWWRLGSDCVPGFVFDNDFAALLPDVPPGELADGDPPLLRAEATWPWVPPGPALAELCRRAFKSGAVEFFEKPVGDDQLLATMACHGVMGIGCMRDVLYRFVDAATDADARALVSCGSAAEGTTIVRIGTAVFGERTLR